MQFLKANTQVIVTVGPFVDVTDGFTPQTDITLSGNEAELLKHGSATVVDISAATWAAVTSCRGYYSLTLTTSHTDTEGMLSVIVQDDSDCLPVRMQYMVLAEAAYDSMFTAKDTGYMDVNVKAISEDTTAADNCEAAFDTTGYAFTACSMPTTVAVTNGVTLAAGAITDASLAGNMEIVFETDFSTNYNTTRNAWATNAQDFVGTTGADPFAGTVVAASVTGAVGSVAGNVDGNVTGSAGSVLGAVNSVTGSVGSVAGNVDGNVTGSVGSNLELGPAEVNAEVVDALATDTYTEPGQEAPGVNVSLSTKIGYLYKAWRNRSTQTSDTFTLYADDTTTVDQKASVSDDATTATKGEIGTGP